MSDIDIFDLNNFDDFNFPKVEVPPPLNFSKEMFAISDNISYILTPSLSCDQNLGEVQKVHNLLKLNKKFTNLQKLEYCSKQRQYMKNYLNKLIMRISK